jgi:hypothetical protein
MQPVQCCERGLRPLAVHADLAASLRRRRPDARIPGDDAELPTKQRPEQKIDAAVALMTAIGRALVEDEDAKGLEGFLTNPIFG